MSGERPYFYYGNRELREIFDLNKNSASELEILAQELSHRKTWQAQNLAKKVNTRLKRLQKPSGIHQPLLERSSIVQSDTSLVAPYYLDQRILPDEQGLSVPYLLPQGGEDWLTEGDLEQISTRFLQLRPNIEEQLGELIKYHQQCLRQIKEGRRYQIPSQGFAEIYASGYLQDLLQFEKIRFVQEGIDPPGVYLRFCFSSCPSIGVVKIEPNLSMEGFYEHQNVSFQYVIEMIALAYYRDLVVPYERLKPASHERKPIQPKPNSKPVSSLSRSLPRVHTSRYHHINFQVNHNHDIADWHMKQEHEAHRVVGHMRKIGSEFEAEEEKHAQAIEAIGKRLPVGYTWVVEHSRGHSQIGLSDLTERITFAHPRNATEEIEQLLSLY